jgi:hypothetical protein
MVRQVFALATLVPPNFSTTLACVEVEEVSKGEAVATAETTSFDEGSDTVFNPLVKSK